MKLFSRNYAMLGAAFTLGMLATQPAQAQVSAISNDSMTEATDGFGALFERIVISFGGVTGLISMAAYVMGIIMLIGGILKVKDYVEDPTRTELKSGFIRLVIGGAFLSLPTLLRLAATTFGDQTQDVAAVTLKRSTFGFAEE